MRIIKFNESTGSNKPHELALSELNLTVKDMDVILYKLSKYSQYLDNNGMDLIKDLESFKKSDWTKLRKWKIENILNRYEIQKVLIQQVDDIEDYLTEVEDEGWSIKINPKNSTIIFSTSEHPIKKMSILFHFLDSNHRLGFILQNISDDDDSIWSVRVKYKIRTSLDDVNKKEEDFIKPVKFIDYDEDIEDEDENYIVDDEDDEDLPIGHMDRFIE